MATASLQTSVTGAIGELRERVDKTEERLDNMAGEIGQLVDERIQEGLRKYRIADEGEGERDRRDETNSLALSYADALAGGASGTVACRDPPVNRNEQIYLRCRRSLRLRPIGLGPEVEQVKLFMKDYLKMDTEAVERLGHMTAVRVPYGPKTRHKKEVIVCFDSVEARDVVRSSASNLAGQGSDVGIRLEIPASMRSAMRALQSLSFEIKTKHPASRRNILFDDDTSELVLDFATSEGGEWRRVTSKQAKNKKRADATTRTNLDDCELDKILGRNGQNDGQDEEEPRRSARRGFGGDEDYQN